MNAIKPENKANKTAQAINRAQHLANVQTALDLFYSFEVNNEILISSNVENRKLIKNAVSGLLGYRDRLIY